MSKRLPAPVSFLHAALLYGFVVGFSMAAGRILPGLLEMLHDSPHLTWLVLLATWLSPILLVAIGHNALHALMDGIDPAKTGIRGFIPGAPSAWAGVYGWLVAIFATVTAYLAILVLEPPRPESMISAFRGIFAWPLGGASWVFYTPLWIVISALLYEVERTRKA